jgi:hypothetical protein
MDINLNNKANNHLSSVEANVLKLETLLLNGLVLSEGHTLGHHIDAPHNHVRPLISIQSLQ